MDAVQMIEVRVMRESCGDHVVVIDPEDDDVVYSRAQS